MFRKFVTAAILCIGLFPSLASAQPFILYPTTGEKIQKGVAFTIFGNTTDSAVTVEIKDVATGKLMQSGNAKVDPKTQSWTFDAAGLNPGKYRVLAIDKTGLSERYFDVVDTVPDQVKFQGLTKVRIRIGCSEQFGVSVYFVALMIGSGIGTMDNLRAIPLAQSLGATGRAAYCFLLLLPIA
ncbi:MAG: DUF3244 domain-containing protein [Gemmataceae bacterium]|nr:DUF3244 domain-containing protein [Gemmataceae bacterium]MCI0743194.1 DUF3244 domain-containing protein [Gemmataceae bacterium]